MANVNNITHLEILKGYKDYLYQMYATKKTDAKELEIWLVGVVNVFKNSVYSSEIGDTAIISEMNSFVVRFNGYKSQEELAKDFNELVESAEKIIDRAIATTDTETSIAA